MTNKKNQKNETVITGKMMVQYFVIVALAVSLLYMIPDL